MTRSVRSPRIKAWLRWWLVGLLGLLPGSSLWAFQPDLKTLCSLSLAELAEIDVSTPTKTAQKRSETPATVRIITAREIAERGYVTLEDALADLPGIQFRNPVGFNSYVFVRGVPNQNNLVLVLIDGVQMNELNSGGFYGGPQWNLANVERIEVVYGPASALYGTNAVAGVINLITRQPRDMLGGQGSLTLGTFAWRRLQLSYGHYDEASGRGVAVAAMTGSGDKADLRGARGDDNWGNDLDTSEHDLAVDVKAHGRDLTFGLNLQDKQASYATKERRAGTPFQDHGIDWHIRFLNTYLKYDRAREGVWAWQSLLYYRDTTVLDDTLPVIHRGGPGDPGYQERWYRPNHLLGLEHRWTRELGASHTLTLGLVREREALAETYAKSRSAAWYLPAPTPNDPEMVSDVLTSAYAQWRWHPRRTFSMTAGVRRDDSDVYGQVVTPRLGFAFNRGKVTAKGMVGEAFRAPKPWDYRDGLGNPDLAPETMKSRELTFGYAFDSHLRAEVAAYRNDLSNCLTRESIGTSWRWQNRGRVRTHGLEGTLDYEAGRTRAYLNVTFTDSEDEKGERVPEISRHTANAGVAFACSERVKIDLRGQYLGPRLNPSAFGPGMERDIDQAIVLHGAVTVKHVHGWDVQLLARNFLDEKYFHPSNTTVSRYRQPQATFGLRLSTQW